MVYYWRDSYKANHVKTKIERFQFNKESKKITVIYRIGNKRLLDKLSIIKFEHAHFEDCSNFDRYRLVKFSTLQKILTHILSIRANSQETVAKFIDNEVNNEQLF